jgi:hypothetical protein
MRLPKASSLKQTKNLLKQPNIADKDGKIISILK